jgi:hypothetical protein
MISLLIFWLSVPGYDGEALLLGASTPATYPVTCRATLPAVNLPATRPVTCRATHRSNNMPNNSPNSRFPSDSPRVCHWVAHHREQLVQRLVQWHAERLSHQVILPALTLPAVTLKRLAVDIGSNSFSDSPSDLPSDSLTESPRRHHGVSF